MSVIAVAILLGRSAYLDTVVSSSLPYDAARATFDTLVRFLRQGVRFVLVLGLVVALAAWLTGPSRFARGSARRSPKRSAVSATRPRRADGTSARSASGSTATARRCASPVCS